MKILALFLVASLAAAADAPKLEFDQTVVEVGKVTEGDELTGKFAFRNTGNAILNIETPETSCGCTVASVKPATVKPGESGEIDFKLDLTNVRGAFKKSISVPSNDPAQPTTSLIISGDAKALFEIEPQLVFFGDVLPGELASATIHVRRLDGKKLVIAHAGASREVLKVSVKPVNETEALVLVETKGTGQPEQFADILDVTLEGDTKAAFHIPLAGQFVASIKVDPAILVWNVPDADHWPGPDADATTLRKLTISATLTNQVLIVENFESTTPDLLVKIVEVKTGQVYEITLKLASPPTESSKEWLTFETNFQDRRTVAVPLRINVPSPSLPDSPPGQ